jgi:hypothetical protein
MHHPFLAQNEEVSIKAMEAFGIALYDKSFIGESLKKIFLKHFKIMEFYG